VCVCVYARARAHTGYEISAHRKLKCAQKIKFQKNMIIIKQTWSFIKK